MGQRIKFLDIAKGLGIILVVLGHSINSDSLLSKWIYSFHMPLFFIISGMCFSNEKYQIFSSFFYKRLKELFLPFFYFTVLITFFSCFLFESYSIKSLKFGAPHALWFLNVLFVSELFYFYISKFSQKLGRIVILFLMLCIGLTFQKYDLHLRYNLSSVFLAVFFYGIGNSYKNRIFQLVITGCSNQVKAYILAIITLLIPALTIYMTNESLSFATNYIPSPILLSLAVSFIGVYGIFVMSICITNEWISKILVFLGKNTLIIMSVHMFFITISSTYLIPLVPSKFFYKILEQIIVWILTVVSIKFINSKATYLIGK